MVHTSDKQVCTTQQLFPILYFRCCFDTVNDKAIQAMAAATLKQFENSDVCDTNLKFHQLMT